MNNKIEAKPEIEATFLEVDKDELRARLKGLGAELLQPEVLMQRTVFDLEEEHAFARVRDEVNKVTMSYKRLDDLSLSGMKEICLEVNDYGEAVGFMKALGLRAKAEEETLREEWLLDGVELDIDTWPWLPAFVEVDGLSEEAVKGVVEKLGYDMKDAVYGSVDEIYTIYYDVTNDDVNKRWSEIKFGDGTIPEWLEKKRLRKSIYDPR